MIATTPSGTRTLWMRRPLGRVQPSVISPTGSASAATWRRPPAMPSTRAGVRRSRSITVAPTPAPRSRSTSSALAVIRSSVRSISNSEAARSAASLAAVDVVASTRLAALARRPSSARAGMPLMLGSAGVQPPPAEATASTSASVVDAGDREAFDALVVAARPHDDGQRGVGRTGERHGGLPRHALAAGRQTARRLADRALRRRLVHPHDQVLVDAGDVAANRDGRGHGGAVARGL